MGKGKGVGGISHGRQREGEKEEKKGENFPMLLQFVNYFLTFFKKNKTINEKNRGEKMRQEMERERKGGEENKKERTFCSCSNQR